MACLPCDKAEGGVWEEAESGVGREEWGEGVGMKINNSIMHLSTFAAYV